jgi:hypothetical protein
LRWTFIQKKFMNRFHGAANITDRSAPLRNATATSQIPTRPKTVAPRAARTWRDRRFHSRRLGSSTGKRFATAMMARPERPQTRAWSRFIGRTLAHDARPAGIVPVAMSPVAV